jgi:formate hydrogenlyase subunit 3/multisubunit Na+/H+ antiporter MnhD subunit
MPEATTTSSIQNLLLTILALVVILISVWSIYAFIRSIILFIFSQGKEESIKKARNSIRFMIMWIFLTVFLLFMFPLVFKRMWLENYEEYNAKNIFNKWWELLNKTLQLKDVIKESQKENQYRNNLYYDDNFSDRFSEDYTL